MTTTDELKGPRNINPKLKKALTRILSSKLDEHLSKHKAKLRSTTQRKAAKDKIIPTHKLHDDVTSNTCKRDDDCRRWGAEKSAKLGCEENLVKCKFICRQNMCKTMKVNIFSAEFDTDQELLELYITTKK